MTRLTAFFVATLIASPALAQQEHWVATWGTALVSRPAPAAAAPGAAPGGPPPAATAPRAGGPPAGGAPGGGRGRGFAPPVTVTNQTLRQIVHTSIGGSRVRVVLSNVFGNAPLEIGAASIALRDSGAAIKTPSLRTLTFAGKPSRAIAPGAVLVSDPVDLNVAALSDLAIDLFIPGDLGVGSSPVTTHNGASQTNYVSATGNHVGEAAWTMPATTNAWLLLARVEVTAPVNTLGLVAFGDSITDGAASTTDTNNRWPDELARRLVARKGPPLVAVVNAGISGNQVLGDGAGVSALARFDKDVLMQSGVTHVVVLEGINDIGIARNNPTPSADDLIAGHKQLIDRAHARGLKICGATLTPYEGAAYYTPEGEAKRSALNAWIRTGKAYDCVIDFDKATRDPVAPTKFLPAYDSGDHLHPGDAGYKAMGAAVDLALFK